MVSRPRVSIVLIFFNGERFIAETLESICVQTFSDWELIAVDDGSTDRSRNIVDRFARRDPQRVRCIEHPGRANRGMSASRNLGICATRAEFVTFIDADDVFLPDKLENDVALLDAHPRAAVAVSPNLRWFSWDESERGRSMDEVQDLRIPLEQIVEPPAILAAYLAEPTAVPLSLMIRRATLEQLGGYIEDFRGTFEDQVAMAKIFLAHPAYVSSRIGCKYRQHADSHVSQAAQQDQGWSPRLRFLGWLRVYLRQPGMMNHSVDFILRTELKKAASMQRRWRVRKTLAWLRGRLGRG